MEPDKTLAFESYRSPDSLDEVRVVSRPPRRRPSRLAGFKRQGMPPIDLDYHPRHLSPASLALLLCGALLAAAAFIDYRSVAADVGHWRSELARAQQLPRGLQAAALPGDEAARQQALQAAAQVAADIRRPWGELFQAVEAAQTDDIALLSFNPDAARGVVRITGEAKRREAVLAYMDRLGRGRVLSNVVLVEDQVQQQDPERPVRFTLSADWQRPA